MPIRAALAALCLAIPATASAQQHAVLAFVPDGPPLAGGAVGALSATVGGTDPDQTFLDVSAGSRISKRAYGEDLPPLRLSAGGAIEGWEGVLARARGEKDIVPGLLATTVRHSGGRVAYIGTLGRRQSPALAAADRAGRLARTELASPSQWDRRVRAAFRGSSLLVAQLPDTRSVATMRALTGPADTLIVAREPGVGNPHLLPVVIRSPGVAGGLLHSASTRAPGLIAATDLAPTVLRGLDLPVPEQMQGHPVSDRPGTATDVRRLSRRLDVAQSRRVPALRGALAAWLLAFAGLWLAGGARGRRAAYRIALLGAMWIPAVALLCGALRPGRLAEVLAIALGSLALGALTDRFVRWPRAPALPAAVVVGAHLVDLAFGSPLIIRSLAGPNPRAGARFFGIGNELEIILSVTLLIGLGALAAGWPRRRAGFAFAGAGLVAAGIMGAGRLGADVGAVITLGAGTAAAVVACLPGRPSRRAILLAALVPVAAVGALALLDVITSGGAHLSRTLSDSSGPGDLVDVFTRRLRISSSGLWKGTLPLSVGIAIALLIYGAIRRDRLLEPLGGHPALRAGITGAWWATVVGALSNDSGPVIVLIGALALVLAVGYAQSAPASTHRP